MLLIFDLDDTLIDTTGCLTPLKLERAFFAMIDKGLSIDNHEDGLEQLKRINQGALSAYDALIEFLDVNEADPQFLEIGSQHVYEHFSADLPVFAFDHVPEVLAELSTLHHLALVTRGYPDQQLGKLKKAGIDSSLFSKIVVCREAKGAHYQQIVEEMSYFPSDVVVCGDRVDIDLMPAQELGFKTVHMKRGRGALHNVISKGKIDATIETFSQIKEVISQFVKNEEFYKEPLGDTWRQISLHQV